MRIRHEEIERYRKLPSVYYLPYTDIQVLGFEYDMTTGDHIAVVRHGDGTFTRNAVRENHRGAQYISTNVNGIRQRVYLFELLRILH